MITGHERFTACWTANEQLNLGLSHISDQRTTLQPCTYVLFVQRLHQLYQHDIHLSTNGISTSNPIRTPQRNQEAYHHHVSGLI